MRAVTRTEPTEYFGLVGCVINSRDDAAHLQHILGVRSVKSPLRDLVPVSMLETRGQHARGRVAEKVHSRRRAENASRCTL